MALSRQLITYIQGAVDEGISLWNQINVHRDNFNPKTRQGQENAFANLTRFVVEFKVNGPVSAPVVVLPLVCSVYIN